MKDAIRSPAVRNNDPWWWSAQSRLASPVTSLVACAPHTAALQMRKISKRMKTRISERSSSPLTFSPSSRRPPFHHLCPPNWPNTFHLMWSTALQHAPCAIHGEKPLFSFPMTKWWRMPGSPYGLFDRRQLVGHYEECYSFYWLLHENWTAYLRFRYVNGRYSICVAA